MSSEVNLEKPTPDGDGNVRTPMRDLAFVASAIIFGGAFVSAWMDDSDDTLRREWTAACVTTVGGASGKVGELTDRGAYVAFADGARIWYPLGELSKSECVELFPALPEPTPSPATVEDVARSNREIEKARKELELMMLKLEQARVARDLYNTLNSGSRAAKP
ncbi:hypothetical protein OIU34_24665 [Pararhizobium sp. BT-229]|uniref:hypothetical protein n=1 Tax=Pararhizobium sp. BT-229 TaxID=2986923 RepID=UPI0021F74F9C|nr:hypothetical protein [Pararhizobium sp. BT-229]MCV9965095.1 hypothetical protein [Pararhizobium sp. BT-229]